jgi:hypothetical protein
MFILLKHATDYKGIIIITHEEYKLIDIFKKNLSDKYYIYGHWCSGFPCNLKSSLATYFSDNIFYKNRVSDITHNKINLLIKSCKINIDIKKERFFDFIHIGRTCSRKNQIEIYNIMKKTIKMYKKKCLLILIPDLGNDKDGKYINTILNDYDKQDDNIKQNMILICGSNKSNDEYCISNSFSYEELSLFLNYSKIYIHSVQGFDESRTIGQALLSGCILLCNQRLVGHAMARKECKNAIVEYQYNKNIDEKINEAIEKQSKYTFNDKLNNIYNEDITIIKELKRYYIECKYDKILKFKDFFDNCDTKLWSLKIAAQYNKVPWNVKYDDEYKYGNPTHHIQHKSQYELLFKFINS